MSLEEAKSLINKLVVIKKAINNSDVVGILNFVGKNEFLNWELQVTVDRLPIQLNSLEQIEEYKGNYKKG